MTRGSKERAGVNTRLHIDPIVISESFSLTGNLEIYLNIVRSEVESGVSCVSNDALPSKLMSPHELPFLCRIGLKELHPRFA